jgi:hypothetical protein
VREVQCRLLISGEPGNHIPPSPTSEPLII